MSFTDEFRDAVFLHLAPILERNHFTYEGPGQCVYRWWSHTFRRDQVGVVVSIELDIPVLWIELQFVGPLAPGERYDLSTPKSLGRFIELCPSTRGQKVAYASGKGNGFEPPISDVVLSYQWVLVEMMDHPEWWPAVPG